MNSPLAISKAEGINMQQVDSVRKNLRKIWIINWRIGMMAKIVISCLIIFFLLSCEDAQEHKIIKPQWSKSLSVNYHQEVNEREQIKIALFLEQHPELQMTKTETGLRYMIYKTNSKLEKALPGQQVKVALIIKLLNGTTCYSSIDDPVEFMVDKSDIESGLNEAVKLMSAGDKAKLLLPSHLALGLVGDQDKIPPLAILYIDVELLEIK